VQAESRHRRSNWNFVNTEFAEASRLGDSGPVEHSAQLNLEQLRLKAAGDEDVANEFRDDEHLAGDH